MISEPILGFKLKLRRREAQLGEISIHHAEWPAKRGDLAENQQSDNRADHRCGRLM
jgi:hypothetical protein